MRRLFIWFLRAISAAVSAASRRLSAAGQSQNCVAVIAVGRDGADGDAALSGDARVVGRFQIAAANIDPVAAERLFERQTSGASSNSIQNERL